MVACVQLRSLEWVLILSLGLCSFPGFKNCTCIFSGEVCVLMRSSDFVEDDKFLRMDNRNHRKEVNVFILSLDKVLRMETIKKTVLDSSLHPYDLIHKEDNHIHD